MRKKNELKEALLEHEKLYYQAIECLNAYYASKENRIDDDQDYWSLNNPDGLNQDTPASNLKKAFSQLISSKFLKKLENDDCYKKVKNKAKTKLTVCNKENIKSLHDYYQTLYQSLESICFEIFYQHFYPRFDLTHNPLTTDKLTTIQGIAKKLFIELDTSLLFPREAEQATLKRLLGKLISLNGYDSIQILPNIDKLPKRKQFDYKVIYLIPNYNSQNEVEYFQAHLFENAYCKQKYVPVLHINSLLSECKIDLPVNKIVTIKKKKTIKTFNQTVASFCDSPIENLNLKAIRREKKEKPEILIKHNLLESLLFRSGLKCSGNFIAEIAENILSIIDIQSTKSDLAEQANALKRQMLRNENYHSMQQKGKIQQIHSLREAYDTVILLPPNSKANRLKENQLYLRQKGTLVEFKSTSFEYQIPHIKYQLMKLPELPAAGDKRKSIQKINDEKIFSSIVSLILVHDHS